MDEFDQNEHMMESKKDNLEVNDLVIKSTAKKRNQMIVINILGGRFQVGPDYKFSICALSSMLFVALSILIVQLKFEVSKPFLFLSLFVAFFQLGSYIMVVISDPGIMRKSVSAQRNLHNKYCARCQILVSKRTFHCPICDACIDGLDHHCPWTSKCIGKNNLIRFYVFIAATITFIMFNTVAIPLALLDV